jgi:hypothetical protein
MRMSPRVATEDLVDAQGVADILGLSHRNTVFQYQRRSCVHALSPNWAASTPDPVTAWMGVAGSGVTQREAAFGTRRSPQVAAAVASLSAG